MSQGSYSGSVRSSQPNNRVRVAGIPKMCTCGDGIVSLISKSTSNPYRRYYRCKFAADRKLINDSHVFKWVDEALVNEVEQLDFQVGVLEEEVMQLRMELRRQRKLLHKSVISVFIGCILIVGIGNYFF